MSLGNQPEGEKEIVRGGARGEGVPVLPSEARHRVRDVLKGAPGHVAEEALENALLVTSELVTNAIRHGEGLTGFSVAVLDDAFLVTVADRSTKPPESRARGQECDPGGFGWRIVRRLANAIAVSVTSTGKTIVVALPLR